MTIRTQLKEVCEVSWGDTSVTKASYVAEGYPAFSASGCDGFLPYFDHDGPGIVLSAIGAQCGKIWFTRGKWSCIKNTILIKARTSYLHPKYLFYALSDPDIWPKRGAAQPFISQTDARNVEIPLPPLTVQRRIAGILSAYDDLIENSQRRIKILESMARALYREWFVHFRFPGHESVPRVPSSLGEIPEGWEVKKLSELVTTQYGYTESTNESPVGPKYLRGMDMNKASYIDWSQVPYCPISAEDIESYAVKQGDVFVIRMADPGKVGIVEQEVDAVFASYLIRLRPKDDRLLPYSLFHLLDSPAYQGYISGASTGTTRKSASAGVITDFQFALPPNMLIADFEKHATTFREALTTLVQQIQNLRRTRDLLLPRLLSGQIALDELEAA